MRMHGRIVGLTGLVGLLFAGGGATCQTPPGTEALAAPAPAGQSPVAAPAPPERRRPQDPQNRRDLRGRNLHAAAALDRDYARSSQWPQLPVVTFEPPTRGYGAEVVAYGRSIGAYGWPVLRNYNIRGGDKKDYVLDERDRRRVLRNIDQMVPPGTPAAFLDLEDHVKTFNHPDTDEATLKRLLAYNTSIIDLVKARRPQTRFAVWNHPNREQVVAKQTDEWRRRQWLWQPMIRKAGLCSANCFLWWNDVERDLAWMVPYLELCLEIAGDDVPVYVTVAPGQQGKMNPVERATLEAIWRRLAEVEVDGRRIAGFDLYLTYKAKNPQWKRRGDPVRKKQLMTLQQAAENDELLKWSLDTLMAIMKQRDGVAG